MKNNNTRKNVKIIFKKKCYYKNKHFKKIQVTKII